MTLDYGLTFWRQSLRDDLSITNRIVLSSEIIRIYFYACYDWQEANRIKGK